MSEVSGFSCDLSNSKLLTFLSRAKIDGQWPRMSASDQLNFNKECVFHR